MCEYRFKFLLPEGFLVRVWFVCNKTGAEESSHHGGRVRSLAARNKRTFWENIVRKVSFSQVVCIDFSFSDKINFKALGTTHCTCTGFVYMC